MRLVVERKSVVAVVERLSARDPRAGEDARAALEWLVPDDDVAAPVLSHRLLQEFLWYALPRKWLIKPDEHLAVAEALALFFDELGPQAASLAALCRDPATTRLLLDRGKGVVELIRASGLEPPDTPLLEWSELMTIEESLERDAVGDMLEDAVDEGRLTPGEKGWQERQARLVELHLIDPDESGVTPITRIRTARREAWLGRTRPEERALLEAALPDRGETPTPAEAEEAVEPLVWLLDRLAGGVKLTQTGAFPRPLVREAVERYPDWWDVDLFGLPYREAEVGELVVLHSLVDELKLARPRRGLLTLGPRGRTLRSDPAALLARIASAVGSAGSLDLDLALADLLTGDEDDVDFRLRFVLDPFRGVVGPRYEKSARVTAGGRTLAAAILRERAYGPRRDFY